MLASITPLGERSRGGRWGVTYAWFAVSAVTTGTGLGAALGLAGTLLPGSPDEAWARAALGVVAVAALLSDWRRVPFHLPSPRRQVNASWLDVYRGWIAGAGFGAQLGAAFTTVVTSAATWVAAMAAFLLADPLAGAVVMGAYGLVRALALLPARRVHSPGALLALTARLDRFERVSARATTALLLLLATLSLGAALS